MADPPRRYRRERQTPQACGDGFDHMMCIDLAFRSSPWHGALRRKTSGSRITVDRMSSLLLFSDLPLPILPNLIELPPGGAFFSAGFGFFPSSSLRRLSPRGPRMWGLLPPHDSEELPFPDQPQSVSTLSSLSFS